MAGGALTSLLTLYAIIRVWGRAFWRPVPEITALDGDAGALQTESGRSLAVRRRVQREAQRRVTQEKAAHLPIGMVGATTAVVAVGLLLTVFAGPIYALTDRAAASLLDRSIYVNAVLGAGEPLPPGSAPTASGDTPSAGQPTDDRPSDGESVPSTGAGG